MVSKKLTFENIRNIRDLGGIITKNGREIKSNKLIRSDSLFKATSNDITDLNSIVEIIIDLRSDREITSKPDPHLSNAEYIHLPVNEKQTNVSIVKKYADNPEGAREFMIDNYTSLVTSNYSILKFQKFVNLLLQETNKAMLWHCSAGKDRTGFATIVVLELLEVSRDVILEDYLYSNNCVEDKKLRTLDLIKKHNIDIDENNSEKISVFHKTLDYLSTVREEYFFSLYDRIKELYGDFDGFINKGLKITDKQRYQFKNLYLK